MSLPKQTQRPPLHTKESNTNQMEEQTQTTGYDPTNSIALSRGQKGTYAWEIKLRWPMETDDTQTLADLARIDNHLRKAYPTAEVA